jgi:hypothetical protein
VGGVRNRSDKQISSIIRREYRSQENLSLLGGKHSYEDQVETLVARTCLT